MHKTENLEGMALPILADPIPSWSFDIFTNSDKPETSAGREFRMCVATGSIKGNKFKVSLMVPQVPSQLPKKGDILDLILYPNAVNDPKTPIRGIRFTLDSEADPDIEVDANLTRFGISHVVTMDLTYKIKDKKIFTTELGIWLT